MRLTIPLAAVAALPSLPGTLALPFRDALARIMARDAASTVASANGDPWASVDSNSHGQAMERLATETIHTVITETFTLPLTISHLSPRVSATPTSSHALNTVTATLTVPIETRSTTILHTFTYTLDEPSSSGATDSPPATPTSSSPSSVSSSQSTAAGPVSTVTASFTLTVPAPSSQETQSTVSTSSLRTADFTLTLPGHTRATAPPTPSSESTIGSLASSTTSTTSKPSSLETGVPLTVTFTLTTDILVTTDVGADTTTAPNDTTTPAPTSTPTLAASDAITLTYTLPGAEGYPSRVVTITTQRPRASDLSQQMQTHPSASSPVVLSTAFPTAPPFVPSVALSTAPSSVLHGTSYSSSVVASASSTAVSSLTASSLPLSTGSLSTGTAGGGNGDNNKHRRSVMVWPFSWNNVSYVPASTATEQPTATDPYPDSALFPAATSAPNDGDTSSAEPSTMVVVARTTTLTQRAAMLPRFVSPTTGSPSLGFSGTSNSSLGFAGPTISVSLNITFPAATPTQQLSTSYITATAPFSSGIFADQTQGATGSTAAATATPPSIVREVVF
ncbi:hypothetical protein SPI_05968 [Niveomyces insectorum RCEF 264]|uniref:Uncharacterized protein n=1 Tax=Niveomyces insectorum RCEF 264 TaxID=1081102 RepID=A0A167SMY8_9HYPO|nr:hypothetical protein SPI_05968 [Niveomyces insectorum RCEF 264]